MMEIKTTGFILYTINYSDCVHFYKEVLNLEVLYQKEILTCFAFGESYLMVELDDDADEPSVNNPVRDRICLRINVDDVLAWCKILDRNEIQYDFQENSWGTIAKFRDPDGNLIGIRSALEHEQDKARRIKNDE